MKEERSIIIDIVYNALKQFQSSTTIIEIIKKIDLYQYMNIRQLTDQSNNEPIPLYKKTIKLFEDKRSMNIKRNKRANHKKKFTTNQSKRKTFTKKYR